MRKVGTGSLLIRGGVTLVGLCVALLLLLPILMIGDPRDDSSSALRAGVVWLSLVASAIVGSLAVAISLSSFLARDQYRQHVWKGAVLLALAVALFVLAFVIVRSELLLMTGPVSLIGLYLGGGLMMVGLNFGRQQARRSS